MSLDELRVEKIFFFKMKDDQGKIERVERDEK